jgi:hypothetical protein
MKSAGEYECKLLKMRVSQYINVVGNEKVNSGVNLNVFINGGGSGGAGGDVSIRVR